VIRHFGRAAELRQAPAESRPREETLNPKNWSHHNRASYCATLPACHSPTRRGVRMPRRLNSATNTHGA
jgi:hypothetical protein